MYYFQYLSLPYIFWPIFHGTQLCSINIKKEENNIKMFTRIKNLCCMKTMF